MSGHRPIETPIETLGEADRDADPGAGRSRPLTEAQQARLAREQGRLIASGRARQGYEVLRTPLRRAIFIAGLAGIVLVGLIVGTMH